MAYQNDEKTNKSPLKHSPFKFGDYVSPNPRPIALGITGRASPLVQYEIETICKTESKPELEPKGKQIYKNVQERHKENEFTKTPKKTNLENRLESSTLKKKVQKKQKELDFLQSQLVKLQIQRETFKNTSPPNENSNERKEEILTNKKRVRIVFDQNVEIMNNANDEQEKSICLTDKISTIRSKKDLTPYKPKQNHTNTNTKGNIIPIKINKNKTNLLSVNNNQKSSRNNYRITPIPQKRNKRIIYKTKLKGIDKKENPIIQNKSNTLQIENINHETMQTPKDIQKLRQCLTPNNVVNVNDGSGSGSRAFDLGQQPSTVSDTSLFLRITNNNTLNPQAESTPEYMFTSSNTNNSASAVVTPILTPMKGYDSNAKPFLFSWNKK